MHHEIKTPKYVIEHAQKNRENLTETEAILWEKLRKKQLNGMKFRCQHPIYRYILDFYCHSEKLAIEIDGSVHEDRKEYDAERDKFLLSIGIKTLRFSVDEILNHLENVAEKITAP